jgi:hypothetical protein
MEASSDTLSRVANENKVANFPTSMDIGSALFSPEEVMKLRTRLGSHITLYLGLGGLWLKHPFNNLTISGCCPIGHPSAGFSVTESMEQWILIKLYDLPVVCKCAR